MKCVIEFPNGKMAYIELMDEGVDDMGLWEYIEKYDEENGTDLWNLLDAEDTIIIDEDDAYRVPPMSDDDYQSLRDRYECRNSPRVADDDIEEDE